MVQTAHTTLQSLGTFLRARRRELSLTQEQLGQRLGWVQEKISALENGKYGMPSLPSLAHLAEALELPVAIILRAAGYADAASSPPALVHTLQQLLRIDALDLAEVMTASTNLVAQALGAGKVDIYLYDERTATLVATGASDTPLVQAQRRAGLDRLPVANGGRIVQVFLTGERFATGDASRDDLILRGFVDHLGIHSMLAMPVHFARQSGVLVAQSTEPDRFSPEDAEFFEFVAAWVATTGKRAETVQQVTQAVAEETRRSTIRDVLSLLAHDLNRSLVPARDALINQVDGGSSNGAGSPTTHAVSAIDGLTQTVEALLDIERLHEGVVVLHRTPVRLYDVAECLLETLSAEVGPLALRGDRDLVVCADRQSLTTALRNVTCAIRHVTPSSMPMVVDIRRDDCNAGLRARVTVRDDAPETPGGVVPASITGIDKVPAPVGLGVLVARGIVEAHGGDLTLDPFAGSGTAIYLTLPLAAEE